MTYCLLTTKTYEGDKVNINYSYWVLHSISKLIVLFQKKFTRFYTSNWPFNQTNIYGKNPEIFTDEDYHR